MFTRIKFKSIKKCAFLTRFLLARATETAQTLLSLVRAMMDAKMQK
jgi:hypothetical protein